jgi:hypothetical protein
MNIPGFTAELALPIDGRGHWQRVNALVDDSRTSVIMALKKNSSQWFQCCCGSGSNQRCTSKLPCPRGCQPICICGPAGTVLAHCRCNAVHQRALAQ